MDRQDDILYEIQDEVRRKVAGCDNVNSRKAEPETLKIERDTPINATGDLEKKIKDKVSKYIFDSVIEQRRDEKKRIYEKPLIKPVVEKVQEKKKGFVGKRNFQGFRSKKDVQEDRQRTRIEEDRKRQAEEQEKSRKEEKQKKQQSQTAPPPSFPRVDGPGPDRGEEKKQEIQQRAEELCRPFSDLSQEERKTLETALRQGLTQNRKDPFKKHREEKGRSENTIRQYQKSLSRVPRMSQGKTLLWYLKLQQEQRAGKRSVSSLNLTRASLLYLCAERGYTELSRALRALPSIHQRQTDITRTRKQKKDLSRLEKVLSTMSKADAHAVRAVLATGARSREIASIQLSFREGARPGIGVKVKDVKTGIIRDFFVKKNSWAYRALAEADKDLGPELFQSLQGPQATKAFCDRYGRVLKKNDLSVTKYSCHALRHQHSSELKRLYPDEKDLKKIANRMGHSGNSKSTARYGAKEMSLNLL